MKHTLEFYDKHGLMLHSAPYAPIDWAPGAGKHVALSAACQFLDMLGRECFPRAKIITLRTDDPHKLFPETSDIVNPGFEQ